MVPSAHLCTDDTAIEMCEEFHVRIASTQHIHYRTPQRLGSVWRAAERPLVYGTECVRKHACKSMLRCGEYGLLYYVVIMRLCKP